MNTPRSAAVFIFCLVLLHLGSAPASSSRTDKITFQTAQFEIAADLRIPDGEGPHPAVIVVHGSGGGTRGYYRTMKSRFVKAGYAACICDKPGFGKSTGQFSPGRVMTERAAILLVKDIDFMAGILPEDRWTPRAPDDETFFNPMEIIEQATIPVLVFYGELDKNVDPVQGAAAYRSALEKAGNSHSRIVVIPDVDHDMVPSKTGCMRERSMRSNWRPAPEYLDAMSQWLGEIGK